MQGVSLFALDKGVYDSYHFSFSNSKKGSVGLKDSFVETGFSQGFSGLTLSQFNEELLAFENKNNFPAIKIKLEENPQDVLAILKQTSKGKYYNFMAQNVDNIVLGRNLESSSGQEELALSGNSELAYAWFGSADEKIIFVDSYNSAFNSLTASNQNDKKFTEFAQLLSVVSNQLKMAHAQESGYQDSLETYTYLSDFFEDIDTQLNNGSYSFLKTADDKAIFSTAVEMMKNNIDKYVEEKGGSANLRIKLNIFA